MGMAPGCDGLPAEFYRTVLPWVGTDPALRVSGKYSERGTATDIEDRVGDVVT